MTRLLARWLSPWLLAGGITQTVNRSAAFRNYGDAFTYQESYATKTLKGGLCGTPLFTLLAVVCMGLSPIRFLLSPFLPKSGARAKQGAHDECSMESNLCGSYSGGPGLHSNHHFGQHLWDSRHVLLHDGTDGTGRRHPVGTTWGRVRKVRLCQRRGTNSRDSAGPPPGSSFEASGFKVSLHA
eukprot:jgi/Botrbrau1/8619/Bobra.0196s0016.1